MWVYRMFCVCVYQQPGNNQNGIKKELVPSLNFVIFHQLNANFLSTTTFTNFEKQYILFQISNFEYSLGVKEISVLSIRLLLMNSILELLSFCSHKNKALDKKNLNIFLNTDIHLMYFI